MSYRLKLTSTMDQDQMEPYWPQVIEQLEDYVKLYPAHTSLDILFAGLARGDFQLWIVIEDGTNECVMSVVTNITKNDVTGDAAVGIYALAGEHLQVVAPMIDDIIAWARKHFGITEAEITGRPGIARVLRNYGFTHEAVVMKRSV